jgi:hypothetical protein
MGLPEKVTLRWLSEIASRGLFAPGSLSPDEIQAVCATALMNVPDHRRTEMAKLRPVYEQIDMALAVERISHSA